MHLRRLMTKKADEDAADDADALLWGDIVFCREWLQKKSQNRIAFARLGKITWELPQLQQPLLLNS